MPDVEELEVRVITISREDLLAEYLTVVMDWLDQDGSTAIPHDMRFPTMTEALRVVSGADRSSRSRARRPDGTWEPLAV